MHQNSLIADEVGIEVSDFKVIDFDSLCKLFKLCTCYERSWTVKEINFIAIVKIASRYQASVNNIEWVVDIMIIASFLKNVNEKESRGFEIIDTSALLILLQLSIVHLSFFEIFSSFNNFRICRKYGDWNTPIQ